MDQIGFHGKVGLRQVECLFVFHERDNSKASEATNRPMRCQRALHGSAHSLDRT